MEFEIKAKYDEIMGLQKELEETKKKLVDMDEAADPKKYERLEAAAHDLAVKIGDLEDAVGMTAGALHDKLGEALKGAEAKSEAAKARLDELGAACAASKQKMNEMNSECERLTKALYDAETGGGATSSEIDKLRQKLTGARDESVRLTKEYYTNLDAQNNQRLSLIKSQVEVDKLKASFKDLNEQVSQHSITAEDIGNMMEEKLKNAALGVAKLSAAAAGGFGLKSFAQQCVSARSQLQGMQTSLETMVGKNTAQSLFDQLFVIAKRSPLEMTDMVGAEQMMISFGIDAQKSVKYMEAISDISMGSAAKFNSLTLAFSQMSATGKLMGQDLNQMINQGFNPLEVIAQKTGKSIAQLKDEMSKGKITAEMVQQAFIDVTAEGGRFHDMSLAASKTISGQMSMLQDALTTMYSTIGEKLEPAVMGYYKTMTTIVDNWEKLAPYIIAGTIALGGAKLLIAANSAAKAANTAATTANTVATTANTAATAANSVAQGANSVSLRAGIKALWAASAAQKGLNVAMAACPYVAAALAIAAIAGAVYNWATSMTKAEESQEKLKKAMLSADEEADKELQKFMDLDASLQKLDKTSAEYINTRKKMVEEAAKWDSEAANEIEKNGLTAESYGKLSDAIQEHYRRKALLRWKDQQTEERQTYIREELSAIRENLIENYANEAGDDKNEKAKRMLEINKAMAEVSQKAYAGTLQAFDREAGASGLEAAGNLFKGLGGGIIGIMNDVEEKQNAQNEGLSESTVALFNSVTSTFTAITGIGDTAVDKLSELATSAKEWQAKIDDDAGNAAVWGVDLDKFQADQGNNKLTAAKKRTVEDSKKAMEAATKAGKDSAESESAQIRKLNGSLAELKKGTAEYKKAQEELIKIGKKYGVSLESEVNKGELSVKTYQKLTDTLSKYQKVKEYARFKMSEETNRDAEVKKAEDEIRTVLEEWVSKSKDEAEKFKRSKDVSDFMAGLGDKLKKGDIKNVTPSLSIYAPRDKVAQIISEAQKRISGINSQMSPEASGLTKEDLNSDWGKKAAAEAKKEEEDKKKAAEEAKKTDKEKKAEAAKKKKDDAAKAKKEREEKTKQAKAELLRKKVAAFETKSEKQGVAVEEDSLEKRRQNLILSYEARRKEIEQGEKEITKAVKDGVIKQDEADKMRVTLSKANAASYEFQNKDLLKLYTNQLTSYASEVEQKTKQFNERRLALTKEYHKKRADLLTVISSEEATDEQKDKAQKVFKELDTTEKADQAKIDLEEFQGSDTYTKVFQDLNNFGLTTIQTLKDKMTEFGDAIRANLSPADAKAFEEAVQKIDERLAELDPFSAYSQGRADLNDALQRKAEATERLVKAQKELNSIESQLASARKKEKKDETAINKLLDQKAKKEQDVADATSDVVKAEDDSANASKKLEKSKSALSSAFSELENNAKALNDALGGEMDGVFTFIDSTVTLVKTSVNGIETVSTTTVAALKAVETASVILAIIAAAIQMLKALDGLFGGKGYKQNEEYEKAVKKQQELNKMREAVEEYTSAVLAAKQEEESWFSNTTLNSMTQNWETATDALEKYHNKLNEEQIVYRDRLAGNTSSLWGDGNAGGRDSVATYNRLKEMGYDVSGLGAATVGNHVILNSDDLNNYKVKAIDNLRFETQSRKHGTWFRKGRSQKTVDLRTWTKDNLGVDLFDPETDALNLEAAETLLNNYSDKLVGETKDTLEALVEQQKAYNEAMDQIKQSVSDMFSPIVDDLSNAIWNWLETGEDALDTFKDSASSTFKAVAQDMIKTMANKLIFDQYDTQMQELGEKYAKGEIDSEQLMKSAIDITEATLDGADSAVKTIEEVTKRVDDYAKEKGYDMTGASSVEASSGGFETMSETTATELSGRFTALYESGLRQEALMGKVIGGIGAGGLLSVEGNILSITTQGISSLVSQQSAVLGVADGISDCLAQSYITLQEISETARTQAKSLSVIQAEIIKVRKVTDTL